MKKRFVLIVISVLLAVTFVTAFCAYAKPPFKVTLLGAYSGDSSAAWHSSLITPVNNTVFGIYSPAMVHDTTQIWFYFDLGVNNLSSFQIHLKRLSTSVQDNITASISSYAMYLWDYNGSVTSNQISIRTQVEASRTINEDGTADYVYTWHKSGDVGTRSAFSFILPFQTFVLSESPVYFEMVSFSVNGESSALTYTDQKLDEMMNYDSHGGSSDTEGASEMVETIAGDVTDINNSIQQHTPHVQNWFETSPVATDLVNIALLANSWLPAYLNCDPDVSFYWGLVTFCILLTLIENGLRRRPWHGFDDGGDFESEYDVTSTDDKGRIRTIHNKVSGSRRRIR